MGLAEKLRNSASADSKIALGVRAADPSDLEKCIQATDKVERLGHGHVTLVGDIPQEVKHEKVFTEEPERKLIELLLSGRVDAAVRGTAKASLILKLL